LKEENIKSKYVGGKGKEVNGSWYYMNSLYYYNVVRDFLHLLFYYYPSSEEDSF